MLSPSKWDNVLVPLGVYISVPFCRTKCSYCNFASDVFSRAVFERYVDQVCADILAAPRVAAEMGGQIECSVDSIYLGGGTPTVLDPGQLVRIFEFARAQFEVSRDSEITVECAPGTLTPAVVESLLRCGVNRVSLGVQSFVDREAAAVGRLHKREQVIEDVAGLRAAGIPGINIDLIAGLPHQTAASWEFSLSEAIALGAPHVSVYMLEVDDESRLGRELLAGGTRYHAHFVPDEEAIADFYLAACERLNAAGIVQYEISNFARRSSESRHNLKYWTRRPYMGFGVDAHSMLISSTMISSSDDVDAVRFASADSLDKYMSGSAPEKIVVSRQSAWEESFFLGLRLTSGVSSQELAAKFGRPSVENIQVTVDDLVESGLMEVEDGRMRLTPRGRLLSNEVFERFLAASSADLEKVK